MRGGKSDSHKKDGREVGGHQFAHEFPLQKDFDNNPRVWVRRIEILKPPYNDGVNWYAIPFFLHLKDIRN